MAMQAETVVALYTTLVARGVRVWVDGGWGIDALLAHQTRPHKDFDMLIAFDDLATMIDALAPDNFTLKEIWSENRWVACAASIPLIGRHTVSNEVATAFVLRNAQGHELDVHVLALDDAGNGLPAWETDLHYPADALAGRGSIAGTPVCCLSAQMQMATRTGYALQAKDLRDLQYLHERFGTAYLDAHASSFAP